MSAQRCVCSELGTHGEVPLLEQPNHLAGFQIQVNVVERRPCWQPRHRAHRPDQRVEEARTYTGPNLPNWQREAGRATLQVGVVAQAEVRFGHAHG